MRNDAAKMRLSRFQTPTFELELTKAPNGKVRSFRISISIAAVGALLLGFGRGLWDHWPTFLKSIAALK